MKAFIADKCDSKGPDFRSAPAIDANGLRKLETMGQFAGRSQIFADDVVQVARAGKTLQRPLPLDALRNVLRGAEKEDKAAA